MISLFLPLASGLVLNHAAVSRVGNVNMRSHAPLMQHGGKGFGGGEATRDPCVFAHQTTECPALSFSSGPTLFLPSHCT
jgi:hypothetical protein